MKLQDWMWILVFCGSPAMAAQFTVGAGGTHATVQSAINAALVSPDSDEIRIAAGTYFENLAILPAGAGGSVIVSGGWDAAFLVAGDEPSVVDGGTAGSVADIYLGSGDSWELRNLGFRNGSAADGAGLFVTQVGNSNLRIDGCEIVDNIAASGRSAGAGLNSSVSDTSQFEFVGNRVSGNQAICSGIVDCREGGMGMVAGNAAQVLIMGNEFSNNSVFIADGSGFAGGARMIMFDTSSLVFEDNRIIDNSVTSSSSSGLGSGLAISGSGTIVARRNRIEGNSVTATFANQYAQVSFFQFGDGSGTLSDSLIAGGNGRGLSASVSGSGTPALHMINLTVTGHADIGIQFNVFAAAGTATLSNTISVDNGTNTVLDPAVSSSSNLVGGSAGFVDPGAGNYTLLPTSPARDSGNNAPSGGLGPLDIAGHARVINGVVDRGAWEFDNDPIFADGFD